MATRSRRHAPSAISHWITGARYNAALPMFGKPQAIVTMTLPGAEITGAVRVATSLNHVWSRAD